MLIKLLVKKIEDGQLAIYAKGRTEDGGAAYLAPISGMLPHQILREGEEPDPTIVCDTDAALVVMQALQESLEPKEAPQTGGYSLEDIHKADTEQILFLRSVIGMLLTNKVQGV